MEPAKVIQLSEHQKDELTGTVPPPQNHLFDLFVAVGLCLVVMVVMTSIVAFTWLITTSLYHRFTQSP